MKLMKPQNQLIVGLMLALAACTPQQETATSPQAAGPNTLNVADAAIAGGDPAMALSVSQSVLQGDPNDVDALIHEGDAYYALQRCPDSMAAYTLALKLNPKSSVAETGLGRCLLKTDPSSAEAAFSLAVQDDPGNAAALNDLGIARDLQGNFAGAINPYQEALLAQPGTIATEVNLGLSLALSGNGAEALQYLGPLAAGPEATAKIRENYAAALIASGRDEQARQVLAIDLPPDKVDSAMAGFVSVLSSSQPALSVGQNDVAPPPTAAAAPTLAVSAVPLNTAEDAVAAAPAPPVSIVQQIHPAPSPPAPRQANIAAPKPAGALKATTTLAQPDHPAFLPRPLEVQLGALNSHTDAQQAWVRMVQYLPALFNDRHPDIHDVNVNGRNFYRLRTGSFSNVAEASKFCGELSVSGCPCVVAEF